MFPRIIIWLAAIFAALFPLLFLVIKEKGLDFKMLLVPAEYDGLERDLCFVAIAILIVGLVDAGEVILLSLDTKEKFGKINGGYSVAAIAIIAIEIMVFSSISGSVTQSGAVPPTLFYFFFSTILIAAACRYQLLVAPQ